MNKKSKEPHPPATCLAKGMFGKDCPRCLEKIVRDALRITNKRKLNKMDANELTNRYKPFNPDNGVPPSPEEVREMLLTLWDEAVSSPEYNKKRWQAFEIMLELYTGIVFHPNREDCPIVPVDMIIHCPKCKFQHVDMPAPEIEWFNPIHKSHRCANCLTVFRTADIYTNGVHSIQTRGASDTWPNLNSDSTLWTRIKKFFQKKG